MDFICYVIISATPIPGNKKMVGKAVDELLKQGAETVCEKMYDVHVSGHACQKKLLILYLECVEKSGRMYSDFYVIGSQFIDLRP